MVSTVDGVGQKLRAQMSGPGMLPSESHDLKACKKASNLRSISYEDLVLPRSFRDFEAGLELGSRLGLLAGQGGCGVHPIRWVKVEFYPSSTMMSRKQRKVPWKEVG